MEKIRLITERPFLRAPDIHVGMKAEIAGRFTDDQFLAAVQKTCIKWRDSISVHVSSRNQAFAQFIMQSGGEIIQ